LPLLPLLPLLRLLRLLRRLRLLRLLRLIRLLHLLGHWRSNRRRTRGPLLRHWLRLLARLRRAALSLAAGHRRRRRQLLLLLLLHTPDLFSAHEAAMSFLQCTKIIFCRGISRGPSHHWAT
jgi:hypothetical protein